MLYLKYVMPECFNRASIRKFILTVDSRFPASGGPA